MISNRSSLRKKILVPLLLVLIATLAAATVENVWSFRTHLTARLQERAKRAADLVKFIAGSAQKPAELQHLVSALGGEAEVNLIVVMAGEPARVVASSRMELVGKSPKEMPDLELRGEMSAAMTLAPGAFHFDQKGGEFDYFEPLSVATQGPGGQQLQLGVVMVALDTRPLRSQVRALTVKTITADFVAVLLLAVSCWVLLNRHVLRPVKQIGSAVTHFQAGNATRISGATVSSQEFGELTGAWNGLVDRLGREEEDRKRADEALDASRQQLEGIINSVDGIVWEADAQTFQFTFVSQKAAQILGYPVERWTTEATFWRDHLHPEDRTWASDYCLTATRELRSHEFEYRMLAADGREVWVRDIVTVIGENGKPVKLRGIIVDITESKRAEALLRESEARLQVAIQASNLGPWDWNLITNKVHFSPEWKRQLGFADEEMAGHFDEFRSRLHPEDCDRILSTVQAFVADRDKGYDVEFRMRHKDGSYRWIHTRGTMLFDDADKPVRMLGCHLDITERKLSEAELEKVHKELVDASRYAGMAEVASSVLHNVGNVLNSVNISIGVATEKVGKLKAAGLDRIAALVNEHAENLPAFFAEHAQGSRLPKFLTQLAAHFATEQRAVLGELASLRGNVEHINEIVAMQQSLSGAFGVVETLPLAEVIEDALRMNATAFERHGTQVVREFDPALPSIPLDRHKLLLILMNLVRNANHACDEGEAAEKRITVRAHLNGHGMAKISVSDNGVGIPRENLTRIFEHGFTTRKSGHGFGLHSSALAASDMGGSLQVHSAGPGLGATFTIELPLTPAHS